MNKFFFLIALLFSYCLFGATLYETDELFRAEDAYHRAEAASDLNEKKELFNQSLKEYLNLSKTFPSGPLYYNIGNCYYQLQEYGLANLFYAKALREIPRDREAKQNFIQAQIRSGHAEAKPLPYYIYAIPLSKKEWWQLTSFFIFTFGLSFLVFYWTGSLLWKKIRRVNFIFLVLLLTAISYIYLFFPLEAMMVVPTTLRKGAGEQYASVSNEIILPGTRVQFLSISGQGTWSKVKTEEDQIGFVPSETLRMIEN